MAARRLARVGTCWLLALALHGVAVKAEEDEDSAIPDKVGAEVHLSKGERQTLKKVECGMCKAILREMHVEVKKHAMTQKGWGGESHVWETANAMCLGLLQKYKLDLMREKIEKKAEDEDENMGMGGGDPAATMRAMLVLKMGCSRWLEDYGGDTSGFIYKRVQEDGEPEASAKEFCGPVANQCGKQKKDKQKKEKEIQRERASKRLELRQKEDIVEDKRKADDPFSQLPKDSMAGLQRMLEMAKDDPLAYMEEPAKIRIQQGAKDLRCDVCRVALQQVAEDVSNRPKSMRAEYDILPFIEGACSGGKDLSVPSYFGVEPPPIPALWTDKYRPKLDKSSKQYRLKSFPKKAAKKRAKWRGLTPTGKQKPPPPEEHEADLMMTMSCTEAMEPASMTEVLFSQMGVCSGKGSTCDAALATARLICKNVDDTPCAYEDAEAKKKSEEL